MRVVFQPEMMLFGPHDILHMSESDHMELSSHGRSSTFQQAKYITVIPG